MNVPACDIRCTGKGLQSGPRGNRTMQLGSRIAHFEVLGLIGAGGMGEVEPFCGRERSGSPQAKSRAKRGISC